MKRTRIERRTIAREIETVTKRNDDSREPKGIQVVERFLCVTFPPMTTSINFYLPNIPVNTGL